MTNLNDILSLLGGQPLKSRFSSPPDFVADKVEFLSISPELQANTAYITTEDMLESELRGKHISPQSIVICAVKEDLVREHDLPPVNIIFLKTDALTAFSVLNRRMREYGTWQIQLANCVHEHGTLASVAETCSKICRSPVFIVNADRQIVAYAGVELSPLPFARRLAKRSQLHDNLDSYPRVLLHEGRRSLHFERAELSSHEGLLLHLWRNSRDGDSMFALMIEQSAASSIADMNMLAYYTCISIFKLRERFSIPRETTKFSFHTIMADIISGQLTQSEPIEMRLESVGIHTPERHIYHLILAEPTGKNCDLVGFNSAIETLLPGGASYGHRGKTLYLWPATCPLPEAEAIEKVFREFGYTGIVGDESFPQGLRMQYKILEQALHLRERAYWLKNRFMCYYAELRFLNVVDILYAAAPDFFAVSDHDAIRHLVSPAVEQLYAFDKMNHAKLRDVLRTYLLTNCSLTRTAAHLYMHKNTVAYKLKQINSIVGSDLRDGHSNANLLLSCAILDYLDCHGQS